MVSRPRQPAASLAMVLASATICSLTSSGTFAGGSIALEDVRLLALPHKELTATIDGLVAAHSGRAEGVVCIAQRLGRQWVHLGGARIPPIECTIGERTIEIDAKVLFFDRKGRLVGATAGSGPSVGDATFANATRFRMDAPTWTIKGD